MSAKSISKKVNIKRIFGRIWLLFAIPAFLVLFWGLGAKSFYLCSLIILVMAVVPFLFCFDKLRPQARDIIALAVLSAIAVISRTVFAMIPHFKPMAGIIMITGMAFGAEAGFLAGTVSAFASDFIFGQGMWTPWQMFAYGIGGFLAGIFCKWNIIGEKSICQRVITSFFGFAVTVGIIGPILDLCSVFTKGNEITRELVLSMFLSGFPVNVVHGMATAITILLLSGPMMDKLNRMKIKYGVMIGD